MTSVIKKSGVKETFNPNKIKDAVLKSATRVVVELNDDEINNIINIVENNLSNVPEVNVSTLHNIVESALDKVSPIVAKSYREYRDNKAAFAKMLDKVYSKKLSLNFIGDRSNANSDSAIVTTQRAIVYNELNSELYKKFFLTAEEEKAMSEGFIYVHDRGSRLDSFNCFERATRFITNGGIKSFYDFKDGDETYVITHKGNWKKAVVRKYGWQKLQKVSLRRGSGQIVEVNVTPNHRWIKRNGEVTTNLAIGDFLYDTPDIHAINWDEMSNLQKKLWCTGFGYRGENSYQYGLYTNVSDKPWRVVDIVPYRLNPKAEVWCLEVEDDHSFLLEHGIPTGNCCLADVGEILTGGFEMGNLDYAEPKTLDVAFDLVGDIIMNMASCQYGRR